MKSTAGYNQLRWDLIINNTESPLPYFIHYNELIESGTYQVELTTGNETVKGELIITAATAVK